MFPHPEIAAFRINPANAREHRGAHGLHGGVAEWSNAPVLKTGVGQKPTVGSNPTSSATVQ